MLTGTRLFASEDVSDTLAAVLRQPIAFTALPKDTPAVARAVLERCLERDARQRLRDIGEARIALERTAGPGGAEIVAAIATRTPASRVRTLLPWVLFTTTAVALAGVLAFRFPSVAVRPTPVTRFSVSIGVPGSLAVEAGPAAVLSPDGRTIILRVRQETTTRLY